MGSESEKELTLILIGLTVGFIVGFFIGIFNERGRMEDQAIERNYAHYHPTTGEWQWKPTPTPPHLTPEAGGPE